MASLGPRLYQSFLDRNLLVRPLGNTIYVMPPYCSQAGDIARVYEAIAEIADSLG
jgi:adenosylmethionine-8-amino-7-oxononanoate aminotransferase